MDVEQHCAGSVCIVCNVNLAAGQFVNQPGVDCAEKDFAFFSFFAHAFHIVQNPFDFCAGEVGVYYQAGAFLDVFVKAAGNKTVTDVSCAAALPYDSIVNRASCGFVPQNCGFALVCDADTCNFSRVDTAFYNGFDHNAVL